MGQKRTTPVGEWVKTAIILFVLFIFIRTFLFSSYEVEGDSMKPTLQSGNKLVVNKISYQLADIKRFDVIIFHRKKEDYVKRVIGLPGDKITYADDHLFINGNRYREEYLEKTERPVLGQKMTGDFTLQELTSEETVPEGELFVMGDNRLVSLDSRHFGFVPIDKVVGRVDAKYWPLGEFNLEM
ncbi:signal peptidase I [Peribacillus saganii]|uniref:Signal peptidase I n=1 Tax=Peribacillus saganii TaxID=2303992 RepID=A0A372LCZ1_9BACI|nr:signal peptidase I [Peribacillus saganii]RFU63538.1 signal peptidase I [Peribacillus saganii]